MKLNEITADMKFMGSSVKEIKVKNTIINLPPTSKKTFSMGVVTHEIQETDEGLYSVVEIKITVDVSVPKCPEQKCKIVLQLEGAFSTKTLPKDTFKQMLCINGGSTLFSIARAQIQNISSFMFTNGKILLPLVNMIKYFEEVTKENDNTI